MYSEESTPPRFGGSEPPRPRGETSMRPAKPWVSPPSPPAVSKHPTFHRSGASASKGRWKIILIVFALVGAIAGAILAPRLFNVTGTPERLRGSAKDPAPFDEVKHASPGHFESDSISVYFNTPEKPASEDETDPDGRRRSEHDPNATGY